MSIMDFSIKLLDRRLAVFLRRSTYSARVSLAAPKPFLLAPHVPGDLLPQGVVADIKVRITRGDGEHLDLTALMLIDDMFVRDLAALMLIDDKSCLETYFSTNKVRDSTAFMLVDDNFNPIPYGVNNDPR